MKLIFSAALCFLGVLACANGSSNPSKTDNGDTDSSTGWCEQDPTWICPELCDLMTCAGMTSECIRACSAELQDCGSDELKATCACFESHLDGVVCQTWEAAQPAWDSCISAIGCFDDY
jgi:hypothetical protein